MTRGPSVPKTGDMPTDPDDLIEELREAASIPLYDERGNRFSISDLLEAAATRIEEQATERGESLAPASLEETEDAPLWRMARKEWSRNGLTTADVAAEGYQFNDRSCWADVAAAHRKVAHGIGGGFDRVGSALVAEFRRLFEPEPDQKR